MKNEKITIGCDHCKGEGEMYNGHDYVSCSYCKGEGEISDLSHLNDLYNKCQSNIKELQVMSENGDISAALSFAHEMIKFEKIATTLEKLLIKLHESEWDVKMEKLKGYTEIGGYSVIYQNDGGVFCAACASEHDDMCEDNGFVYWEGSSLHCEGCNTELESQYGDPNDI